MIINELNFQDAILKLHNFWQKHGCLIWQPYNTEVGAGTLNPATYLRVLGPEPWSVAYVEPSVRPDDSRYGENPNRLQMHTQYQVILKPGPQNPQELYLKSLEALGIDIYNNDLRFVEDNWESPVLGAWGLGWEVWLNGLEITQFTYFQQAGGFTLQPTAVEITYGLERIIMSLQQVDNFKKIRYTDNLSYGEILGQNEYEMSVYNLDEADVSTVKELFNLYEKEAQVLLSKKLPLPAYSYILKTSHTFNILDARGAIGVTERASYFARMRDLARKVAESWYNIRLEFNHPLGKEIIPNSIVQPDTKWKDCDTVSLVLEIGTEELPVDDLQSAISYLSENFPQFLKNNSLNYTDLKIGGTPRRLSIIVSGLQNIQSDSVIIKRGPRIENAYDENNNPTKATIGFAKSNNAKIEDLIIEEYNGAKYLAFNLKQKGKYTGEILQQNLFDFLTKISFTKSMRWNWTEHPFSRPVRWLLALLDEQIIPFSFAGLESKNTSRNLRNAEPNEFIINHAGEYLETLKRNNIYLFSDERKLKLFEEVEKIANTINAKIPEEYKESVLFEVNNLVENPNPILGSFDSKYLDLPQEILISVMIKHQRYFPLVNQNGKLLPNFIVAANGIVNKDLVKRGNESVLRARYEDANFFWLQDKKTNLADFKPKLKKLIFQEKLGSMLDKNIRIESIVSELVSNLKISDSDTVIIKRAAFLCKSDLVTQMVIELTSLAGVMGREYALCSNENELVANAIFEHVLPRYSNDKLPKQIHGSIISIADKIDSITGLFAIGKSPKSNSDPFGLRRAGIGLLQIVIDKEISIDLTYLIEVASKFQSVQVSHENKNEIINFLFTRFKQLLKDNNERYDFVDAVLEENSTNPYKAIEALKSLKATNVDNLYKMVAAYQRVVNILKNKKVNISEINPALFENDFEKHLWESYQNVEKELTKNKTIENFLFNFNILVNPINNFFDNVFVMSNDENIRNNRMSMVGLILNLKANLIDLSKIII